MNQIKDDLISEIIRISQTNLLGRKQAAEGEGGEEHGVRAWIKENAANYRAQFEQRLNPFSATELGEILNTLTCSGKDLSEILESPSENGNGKNKNS